MKNKTMYVAIGVMLVFIASAIGYSQVIITPNTNSTLDIFAVEDALNISLLDCEVTLVNVKYGEYYIECPEGNYTETISQEEIIKKVLRHDQILNEILERLEVMI
jgi:hypothetical protein